MTTLISLNNQAFWTPPVTQLAKPRHVHFSQDLTSQSQEATLPAPKANTSQDAVMISSDEESDSNDVDDVQDDETDMADYLPSIAEIASKVNGLERGCVDTAANSATVSERMHCTDVESRRSSISQPSESAPVRSPRTVLSPERAAAARPLILPLASPIATVRSEIRQPNHGEEMSSCEPFHSSAYGNTPQPEPEATPDDALGTALHTTLRSDRDENVSGQPEGDNDSRLDSAVGSMADVVASVTHEADTATMKASGQVRRGLPPAHTHGGATVPESILPPMMRSSKSRPAKRRRRSSTEHSVTATSDGEVPPYKRRKVAASGGLERGARSALSPTQKPRTRASEQETTRRSIRASLLDDDQATDHVDASYQEWPLPDAVLQRTQVNGRATLQLQFTWATSCASHKTLDATTGAQPSVLPPTCRDRGARTRAGKSSTMSRIIERVDSCNTDGENGVHTVARLLARWKRGTYLLEWADGTTSWEPKRNILDRQMIDDFEATYRGFDAGIDVLASRTWKGRQQWRVHWHCRPAAEDCWVDRKLMDPARVEKVQMFGFDISA